jgi:hypothetical protein
MESVARDTGAMRQHIADRYRAIELVVVEPDRGNELLDRFVPTQLSLLDEQAHSDGRE